MNIWLMPDDHEEEEEGNCEMYKSGISAAGRT